MKGCLSTNGQGTKPWTITKEKKKLEIIIIVQEMQSFCLTLKLKCTLSFLKNEYIHMKNDLWYMKSVYQIPL